MPVRSSSLSCASGAATVGRSPTDVPGAGAYGNNIARITAECPSPIQWPSSCVSSDCKSYAPAPACVESAEGVANVACPSLRKNVSESRICPAKRAGAELPTVAPGAFAVNVRVNANTPSVNPALDWLKQIVFRPSTVVSESLVQEFAALTRAKVASLPGCADELKFVPLTPLQVLNEAVTACSISVSAAGEPCAAEVMIT